MGEARHWDSAFASALSTYRTMQSDSINKDWPSVLPKRRQTLVKYLPTLSACSSCDRTEQQVPDSKTHVLIQV